MRLYFTFFAICKTPIMHLACPPPPPPPKNLRKHCLQFLLGRLKYHGDIKKTKVMQSIGGQTRGIIGDVQKANQVRFRCIQEIISLCIECFHMKPRQTYRCSKPMKRRPCWCSKPILWELNSFLL